MMAYTFSHGVHPPGRKEITSGSSIKRFPFAPYLILLLSQHAGKPAVPVVREGQEVTRGDLVARADGFISAPIHAPATGIIRAIGRALDFDGKMAPAIFLEPYPGSPQVRPKGNPVDIEDLSPSEIVDRIKNMGMVGLGGAAFPTHVKFCPPEGKKIDTLIVNGCECEPYLTADDVVMREQSEDVVLGIRLALKALGASRAYVAIEDNKPEAIRKMKEAVRGFENIEVAVFKTKYPQGAEKMLTRALLGKDIPSGGLPADIGVMVSNVATLAEIGALLPYGHGIIERVVTMSGKGITKPGNYLIPIGTPLEFVLSHVGMKEDAAAVIFGGPMMGKGAVYLEAPITKGTSGIVVLSKEELGDRRDEAKIYPCIRCAECVNVCPIHLNPSKLGLLAKNYRFDVMEEKYHLFDCFECGCCSYVCPSNIPLVQYFRLAKQVQRERRSQGN
ncbi:MAG: electron transport complex subunit RsxC [Candidatus Dadabacteria bacterium]|nr:MAG: electron transport complex subunit RsxC [Candidatus Dadabacteria bacterium]